MNYQAFTNDTLLMMHHGARGALAVDDELNKLGQKRRFRVRETPDWIEHASALEAEMLRRGMCFDAIIWSEDHASAARLADLPAADDPDPLPTDPRFVGHGQTLEAQTEGQIVESAARLRSRIAAILKIASSG
ncbi:hypothetical protein [Bradyrhizobium sp. STM 3562]|uniref:hypothetical protein n=1 Tax=Bradyrhizobium sp. STM 3562 TaxID=578924 RepID=UPI00388D6CAB